MKFSLVPAVAFLVATFSGVHAQNISQCVLTCIGQAATANGCDLTNTQCLCTNAALQQAALTCLQQSCTAQDLQNAESLVQSECAGITSSSISFPPLSGAATSSGSGSGSGAGSATATSPAASQTQTQSQSQNAAAPTAFAKAKVGAAVVAVAVGAIVGL